MFLYTKYVTVALLGLMMVAFGGCGVNSSTPEEAYKSMIDNKANNKIDKAMELMSSKSCTEQGVDVGKLKDGVQKNLNDLKAANYKLENINITSTEKLDDNTAIVVADVRYKTSDKQEVQVTKGDVAVFLKEKDGWRLSPNNYVKTIDLGHKCGTNSGVEICLDKMFYYAEEVFLQGTVENKTDSEFSFGFSSLSPMELKLSDGAILKGTHPVLGDNTNPRIKQGKQPIGFSFREMGKYYVLKGAPSAFAISGIVPMNGALPKGFGEGFGVVINIQ